MEMGRQFQYLKIVFSLPIILKIFNIDLYKIFLLNNKQKQKA